MMTKSIKAVIKSSKSSKKMTLNKTTIQQEFKNARNESLYEKLKLLGFNPERDKENEAWYKSPLRNEKTASFKLNKKINKWYDHGSGFGGNTLDFYMHLYNCSPTEALMKINNSESFSFQPLVLNKIETIESQLEILSVGKIRNINLKKYLSLRGLSFKDYENYLHEVSYQIKDRKLYSIGFENIHGGYELRNKYLKNSIGKKGLSIINNNASKVVLFEGFIDFISYQKMYGKIKEDIIILNSVANIEKSYPYLKKYSEILLHLDNDKAGKEAANLIKNTFENVIDKSSFYAKNKDVNELLMQLNKTKKNEIFI